MGRSLTVLLDALCFDNNKKNLEGMKCNLRDGKTTKGCGKWSSWLSAENCFFRISLLLYGYKTIHFVRSGEWRKPLNRWTSTWRYYCAFSPSKMIGCGHVCWIIEQFRLFIFSNSCIMFSLDQGEPNWIMTGTTKMNLCRPGYDERFEDVSSQISHEILSTFIDRCGATLNFFIASHPRRRRDIDGKS